MLLRFTDLQHLVNEFLKSSNLFHTVRLLDILQSRWVINGTNISDVIYDCSLGKLRKKDIGLVHLLLLEKYPQCSILNDFFSTHCTLTKNRELLSFTKVSFSIVTQLINYTSKNLLSLFLSKHISLYALGRPTLCLICLRSFAFL